MAPAAAIAEECFYVSAGPDLFPWVRTEPSAWNAPPGQAGVSGWTKDGSPLMVERLGRADLAGISREGKDLQQLVLYSYVHCPHAASTLPGQAYVALLDTAWRVLFLVCRYMLYLETIFRTCTRLSRER